MYYKFSDSAIENPEGLSGYELLKRVRAGEQLKGKQPLFDELWYYSNYWNGTIKQSGWVFDFSNYFKTYLVKLKYSGWREIKAPNKMFIRLNAITPSYIMKIIELKEA